MKQRITFVHTSNGDFHPKQLNVSSNSFQVKALKAAREEQLTFLSQELLQEVFSHLLPVENILIVFLDIASLEAMLRAAFEMAFRPALSFNRPFPIQDLPRLAHLVHSHAKSLGVCAMLLPTLDGVRLMEFSATIWVHCSTSFLEVAILVLRKR